MTNISPIVICASIAMVLLIFSTRIAADVVTRLGDWMLQGNPTLNVRYRIETVDQDAFSQTALASTLRTRAGFQTAVLGRFSALLELEDVRSIGNDQYDSTTNGKSTFPVVADPEGTELNQAYLMYRHGANRIRAGRQVVRFDNERFIGDVAFRQNQQTYDAVMWMNTSIPGGQFSYGYMDNVRRFLGDDHPLGEFDMNSHVLNFKYERLNGDQFTGYGYFFEMQNAAIVERSHRNIGARYAGSIGYAIKWLYRVEYADQAPYADGLDTNDARYLAAEIAPVFKNQWVLRLGLEYLSGDGTYGFQTPLATNHKFNGRADIFAGGTPPTGLRDTYLKLEAPVHGTQVTIAYHDFQSDALSTDYGTEVDVQLTRRFLDRYSIGLEFATYNAKAFSTDTKKFWIGVNAEF